MTTMRRRYSVFLLEFRLHGTRYRGGSVQQRPRLRAVRARPAASNWNLPHEAWNHETAIRRHVTGECCMLYVDDE